MHLLLIGSDMEENDLLETPAFDPNHMKFVDNRCTCCPYGYHVDLDFLHCLDEKQKSNAYVMGNLRRALKNKRQLRRSMEMFLHQQSTEQHTSSYSQQTHHTFTLSQTPDVVNSAEQFLSTVDRKSEATDKKLDEIDNNLSFRLDEKYASDIDDEKERIEEDVRYRTELAMKLHEETVGRHVMPQEPQLSALVINGGPHADQLNAVINGDSSVLKERLKDLERQVKAIPLLQVSNHFLHN